MVHDYQHCRSTYWCKPSTLCDCRDERQSQSNLKRALDIVKEAAKAGAHAIKLQTYTADTMTLDIRGGSFEISDSDSLWSGNNLHDLYKKAYTPWEWHAPIMNLAHELGLICFSSPFDETAVDF